MPRFEITGPDGRRYEVTAPEGATQEQVLSYVQQSAPQQQESGGALSTIGQALGKTARAGMQGAAGMVGLFTDPLDAGIAKLTGGQAYPMAQAAGDLADKIGLPQPQTPGERVASAIISAGTGGGGGIAAGRAVAQAPGAIGAAGRFMSADPGLQLASTTAGGGAGQMTAEQGGGVGAQALATIAGGVAPGVAATVPQAALRATRGGEASRQAMQSRIADFEAAGTTPTLGQATEGRFFRATESLLSRAPGASGRIAKNANAQADDVAAQVTRIADDLSPRSTVETAGRRIEEGVRGPGGFVQRFKAKAGELYKAVDAAMPGETPVEMKSTMAFLDKAAQPIEGAQATSGLLAGKTPLIREVREALLQDIGEGRAPMPYEAIKGLRTKVGEMIADAGPLSDQPTAQLKQLYGALSQDVRAAAANNPQAKAALDRAEAFYRAGTQRVDAVDRVVSRAGGPEAVFNAAISGTKDGATKLRQVMQSLRPEERKALTATVVNRLGRATPGRQTADGDAFSMESFLTNWNKLAPEAKRALFDREPGMSDAMNRIARAAESVRAGNQTVQNASGTGQAIAQLSAAGTFMGSLMTGQVAPAAMVAGGVASSNLAARLMTNGNFVKWMAKQTQMPRGAAAAQLGVLADMASRTKDPDLQEAVQLFQSTQ